MKTARVLLFGIMAAALPVYALSAPESPGEYVHTRHFITEHADGSTAFLDYRITNNGIILEINDGTDISRRILFLRYIPDETGKLIACLLTIRYMTFDEKISNDYIPDPNTPDLHTAWARNRQGSMELISSTGDEKLDKLDIEREFKHLLQECRKHAGQLGNRPHQTASAAAEAPTHTPPQ